MFIPAGNPPIHGTSFARIAAELGLTAPKRSRAGAAVRPDASVPAQRTSGSARVGVAAR